MATFETVEVGKDEIKYYRFIGSQEDAEGYVTNIPVKNQVYPENKKIGCGTVAYWAKESPVDEISNQWKLVDKPKQTK